MGWYRPKVGVQTQVFKRGKGKHGHHKKTGNRLLRGTEKSWVIFGTKGRLPHVRVKRSESREETGNAKEPEERR